MYSKSKKEQSLQVDSEPRTRNSEPCCAVVVASFRPGQFINQCLSSLLAQQGIDSIEIVVVDSSADGTAARLQRDFPMIKVIELEQQTHQSMARNIGIAQTRAPFIAMTDQDCIVPHDWLARLLARHQEGNYAVVGGAIGNGTPKSAVGTASYLIEFNEFLPIGISQLVSMIPHCNVCFRREVFTTVGPFVAVPPGAEDLVYNFLLGRKARHILFDPAIVVTHQNRTSFFAFLRHQRLLGFGSAIARRTVPLPGQLFVRHPALVFLLPLLRFGRTARRLLATSFPVFLRYLWLSPLLFLGYVLWTRGFRAGLYSPQSDNHVCDMQEEGQPYAAQ